MKYRNSMLIITLAGALFLSGCTALGAAGGGYAGYRLGCKEGNTKEACAAATGAGVIGGAIIGSAVD